MKRLMRFGPIAVIFFLLSCKKDTSSKNNNSTLLGKWSILSDSSFLGVGISNHAVNYVGQIADYFDFKTNGKLFIEEKGNLDVLSYTLTSDSTIIIDSFLNDASGVSETCEITDLTISNAIISTPILATPGGTFGRKVHLTR
jgi:hypothetical protein